MSLERYSQSIRPSMTQLKGSLDEMRGQLDGGAPDPAKLDAVRRELDAFEARWRGAGEARVRR